MIKKTIGIMLTIVAAILAVTSMAFCLGMLPITGTYGLQCQPIRRQMFHLFALASALFVGLTGIGAEMAFFKNGLFGVRAWSVMGGALIVAFVVIATVFVLTPDCPFPTR